MPNFVALGRQQKARNGVNLWLFAVIVFSLLRRLHFGLGLQADRLSAAAIVSSTAISLGVNSVSSFSPRTFILSQKHKHKILIHSLERTHIHSNTLFPFITEIVIKKKMEACSHLLPPPLTKHSQTDTGLSIGKLKFHNMSPLVCSFLTALSIPRFIITGQVLKGESAARDKIGRRN